MRILTIEESFDYYLSTLQWCSIGLLEKSDCEIEYEFVENFRIEYTAFLSPYTRNRLLDYGIIDDEISSNSEMLQNMLLEMEASDSEWNVVGIRNSKNWREVFKLSDKIKSLIYQKWDKESIRSLRGEKV